MAIDPEEITVKDLLSQAAQAEEAGDLAAAARFYQKVIMKDKLNEHGYERLMIVYRRLKDYSKELAVIDKGIVAFEKLYKPKITAKSKKIAELSIKVAKSVGLINKKGEPAFEPGPLGKWRKRRVVVETKIKKKMK